MKVERSVRALVGSALVVVCAVGGHARAGDPPPAPPVAPPAPVEPANSGVAAALDLMPALSALEVLVPSPPWTVRRADVPEGGIREQLADMPPDEVEAAIQGLGGVQGFVAYGLASTDSLVVRGVRFLTEDQATVFVALFRRATEAMYAKMKSGPVRVATVDDVEGAGTGGKWRGRTGKRIVRADSSKVTVSTAAFVAGNVAFDVTVSGREVERVWMDRVVDALGVYVTDPTHPLPKMPADAALEVQIDLTTVDVPHVKFVRMDLLGPDGSAVPRARVAVAYEREAGHGLHSAIAYHDGEPMMWPRNASEDADIPRLLVYGAADETGAPLDFGPLYVHEPNLKAKNLSFVLPTGRTLEGRVVDAAGKGVAGAKVRAHLVQPSVGGSGKALTIVNVVIATAETDAEGRYRLRGLGARTRIDVAPPSPLAAPNPIVVEGTGPAPDVTVAEGETAVVTVVDAGGRPVAGAYARCERVVAPEARTDADGFEFPQVRTDATGRVAFVKLPRGGALHLFVLPPPGQFYFDLGEFEDSGWNGRDVVVRLRRIQRIQGRVIDANGKPVADATAHLLAGRERWTTPVQPDGSFFFRDVDPGPASVGATTGPDAARREPTEWIPVVDGMPVEIVLGGEPIGVTIRGLGAGRRVYTRRGGPDGPLRERRYGDDGKVPLPGEPVGSRIDVFVPPTAGDPRGLFKIGVELTAEGASVDLVDGVTTTGTLRAPTKYEHLEFNVLAPWELIPVKVAADGTFALPPLPPGKYTLRAKARGADAWIYARTEFEPGATLDLELRPK